MTAPAPARWSELDWFVGRVSESASLARSLEPGGPRVSHVSGVAGIGKSSLLEVFAHHARDTGAFVAMLDCSVIEPSQPGLLSALAEAFGDTEASLRAVAAAAAAHGGPVVILLDTYQRFWLMDTFIRRELCPALPSEVRLVLAGRNGPVGSWLTSPEWRRKFQSLTLGPLSARDALAALTAAGLDEDVARRVNDVVRGHPLALRVAAGLGSEAGGRPPEDFATAAVVDHLTHEFITSVTTFDTRRALEAACVVRRVTESILGAMLPGGNTAEALDRLSALPFTETRRDGLFVHDAVRDAIATRLAATQPERYRSLRVASWRHLREEVKSASRATLWRYTADILYLLQKPEIREGFFPSGYQPLAVERALPRDGADIAEIAAGHEGPEAQSAVAAWWEHSPQSFMVCRDGDGRTAGAFIVENGARLPEAVLAADPIAAAWRKDMLDHGMAEKSLLLRRLLDREEGEAASGSRGAFGLDVKRTYMEMRPNLRFVYLAGIEPANLDWCDSLGFERQAQLETSLDHTRYLTYRLDMGDGSVDSWLSRLVAAELGIGPSTIGELTFDSEAHEVAVAGGAVVALTPLESAVLAVLWSRPGRPVSRAALFEAAWGYEGDATSNVVDAVVVTLRKKLGSRAGAIETVRGVGYRLRA